LFVRTTKEDRKKIERDKEIPQLERPEDSELQVPLSLRMRRWTENFCSPSEVVGKGEGVCLGKANRSKKVAVRKTRRGRRG